MNENTENKFTKEEVWEKIDNLDAEQKRLLSECINREGTGEHPVAEENNLRYFAFSYTLGCLSDSYPKLNEKGKELAQSAYDTLFPFKKHMKYHYLKD